MKWDYEVQAKIDRHDRINGFLKEIIFYQPGYEDNMLKSIREYVRLLMKEHGFSYVEDKLQGEVFNFYDAAKDYKDEIFYVMDEVKKRFDPSWKHNLLSKKISDMTGYEYQQYLAFNK